MKPAFQFGRRADQPRRLRHLAVIASGIAVALRYCRMAQRDEENGFRCTAALEWRRAAELFAPFDRVAGHCWHEWERIMGMPRTLAGPVGAAEEPYRLAPPIVESEAPSTRALPRRHFCKRASIAFSYLQRLGAR